jgi:hypothetical protein
VRELNLYYVVEKDCWGDHEHDRLIRIYDNLSEAQKHSETSKDYHVEVRTFNVYSLYAN